MRYIRMKDGIFENKPLEKHLGTRKGKGFEIVFKEQDIIKQADTIEELIQIGDIVFYWVSSYEKEHCVMMTSDIEIQSLKYNAITKLLIPVGEDYKCVAKGFPSFNIIKGRKYLVSKGKLELL